MQENKFPYKPPITCVHCGKKLEEIHEDLGIDYGMIDGGIAGRLYGPFGSRHDGIVFQIGLCDDCIDKIKLPVIGSYMFGDIDEIIKKNAFDYHNLKKGDPENASEHPN